MGFCNVLATCKNSSFDTIPHLVPIISATYSLIPENVQDSMIRENYLSGDKIPFLKSWRSMRASFCKSGGSSGRIPICKSPWSNLYFSNRAILELHSWLLEFVSPYVQASYTKLQDTRWKAIQVRQVIPNMQVSTTRNNLYFIFTIVKTFTTSWKNYLILACSLSIKQSSNHYSANYWKSKKRESCELVKGKTE